MTDLIEFLGARLAKDEEAARRAAPGPWALIGEPRETRVVSQPTGVAVALGWLRDAEHIARHGQARVLAEVDAKRRVIEAAEEANGYDAQLDGEFRVGSRDRVAEPYIGDVILRALALPYADHPDYREEWRP